MKEGRKKPKPVGAPLQKKIILDEIKSGTLRYSVFNTVSYSSGVEHDSSYCPRLLVILEPKGLMQKYWHRRVYVTFTVVGVGKLAVKKITGFKTEIEIRAALEEWRTFTDDITSKAEAIKENNR